MDSAPILLPSPRKSPCPSPYESKLQFSPRYSHDETSSDEDAYGYSPSPDEAVFDEDSQDSTSQDSSPSPHTSDDDVISEIPTDADSRAPSTIYTPHKRRSPFRHPSSVRNLQLDTTPPHLAGPANRAHRISPSQQLRAHTPRSVYSDRSRPRSARSSPARKEKAKKERPLVLLHFTLLPFELRYAQGLLDSVLPAGKLADFKLLREKLGQNVVQERGVLIPHPREDYELMEERLLEALDLEQGVLTRDGHFVDPEERGGSRASRSTSRIGDDREDESDTDRDEEEERTEMGEQDEGHLCEDCGRHIDAVGSERRWDIKIYAANGLMREGAWSAAWHEMERVDVEIHPFISDETKRDLENRIEELELLAQAEQRESAARQHAEVAALETIQSAEGTPSREKRQSGLDAERMREIYGEQTQEKPEAFVQEQPADSIVHQEHQLSSTGLPLSTLLANYTKLMLQDRRNVAIAFLSVIIVLMAVIAAQSRHAEGATMAAAALDQLPQGNVVTAVPSSIARAAGKIEEIVATPSLSAEPAHSSGSSSQEAESQPEPVPEMAMDVAAGSQPSFTKDAKSSADDSRQAIPHSSSSPDSDIVSIERTSEMPENALESSVQTQFASAIPTTQTETKTLIAAASASEILLSSSENADAKPSFTDLVAEAVETASAFVESVIDDMVVMNEEEDAIDLEEE